MNNRVTAHLSMVHDSLLAYEYIFKELCYQEKQRCPVLSVFSSAVPQVMLSMAKKVSVNVAYNDADFKEEKISEIQRYLIYFH